jgi:hypothetical protein
MAHADNHSGLFLSAGKAIFISGPGVAVIAYLLMGTLMWYGSIDGGGSPIILVS